MVTTDDVLEEIKEKADPESLVGMNRYGMAVENRLGVRVPELRKIAKRVGKDHQLALELYATGIAEGMIIASMVGVPEEVTTAQMDAWVENFNSWDVCDQVCMNLFDKTPLAWEKLEVWAHREEEFVKRAGYALIASLALHDKQASDERFTALIPLIIEGAMDESNFVKKAVSWALRNIGKRNWHLNCLAIDAAQEMGDIDSRSARWIASDVIRDLTSETARRRLERKK